MGNTQECEICGNDSYHLVVRKIEGVIMNVCRECQNLGEEVSVRSQQSSINNPKLNRNQKFRNLTSTVDNKVAPVHSINNNRRKSRKRDSFTDNKVMDDAAAILLEYRTTKGFSSKEFAESVFIKESYYKRIEKGTTAIPLDLAKKFEKKYKLILVEKEDFDENDDYSKYLKKNKGSPETMIYFKKRGEKPEYD